MTLEEQVTNHINSGKRFIVIGVDCRSLNIGDPVFPTIGRLKHLCQKYPARIVKICSLDEYIENTLYPENISKDIQEANRYLAFGTPVDYYEIHFD